MACTQVPIAIIGAGPAGLLLARLLELARIAYVVFERDASAALANEHVSSGTLDIHKDSGQAALEQAGLMQQFRSAARFNVPTKIVNPHGKVVVEFTEDGDQDKPEIDRKDLRTLLLGSVPANKIRWGYKVQHVQKDGEGSVSIHGANGDVHSGFRLVVGADGAWSKVRKLVSTTHPKIGKVLIAHHGVQITSTMPQYSGTQFFSGFIKADSPVYSSASSMAGNGNYLALGQGRQIFLHRLGDGSYHLGVGLRLAEGWVSESRATHEPKALWRSLLKNEFAEWGPSLTDLVESGDEKLSAWPFYSTPKESLPWKHMPGVVLVGDAAHLT